MALEEVITGLKNGIARGESLQKAMQTLIYAGYSQQEVEEAARQINLGVIGNISNEQEDAQILSNYQKLPTQVIAQPSDSGVPESVQYSQSAQLSEQTKSKKFPKWMLIVIVLCVLIIIGGALLGYYGPQILDALAK